MKLSCRLRRTPRATGLPPGHAGPAVPRPSIRRRGVNPTATRFTVRTRIARSLGKADTIRYQLDALRVLPGPQRDRVIVQATDGHQAVCVIAPGSCDEAVLIPGEVLPTRKTTGDIEVYEADIGGNTSGWRSSNGKLVEGIAEPKAFPSVCEVLPVLQCRGVKPHVTLGIDVTVLAKVADSLGTPKLTLMITPPENGPYVNRAVAVCPADDVAGVHGIAVVMPVSPKHNADYYTKVRKDVVAAEVKARNAVKPVKV